MLRCSCKACSVFPGRPHLPFHVADDISFHARLDLDSFQSFLNLRLEQAIKVRPMEESGRNVVWISL